jgi:hypothetical protein
VPSKSLSPSRFLTSRDLQSTSWGDTSKAILTALTCLDRLEIIPVVADAPPLAVVSPCLSEAVDPPARQTLELVFARVLNSRSEPSRSPTAGAETSTSPGCARAAIRVSAWTATPRALPAWRAAHRFAAAR